VSRSLEPVFEHLKKEAVQSPVLFSDDTGMRVGALRKETQGEQDAKRTGIFTTGIEGRKAEPDSSLGGAIAYMQKRWTQLTQFLRVPGAPIDNNEAQRGLKKCILHRKNSLH
jgi:hypothetical protein